VASYPVHYILQVTDINGDVATVKVPSFHPDTTTLAAVATLLGTFATDIQALTQGKITRQSFGMLVNEAQFLVGTTPPFNLEYSSVTDGAHLSYASGQGERMALTVPAPLESIFGANSNVVDSTNANVATLSADIAAHAASPANHNYNLYKGGVKVGKHSRRRATRLIP